MKTTQLILLLLVSVFVTGCGETTTEDAQSSVPESGQSQPSVEGKGYLLSTEPAGAADVIAVRQTSKDGDDVVLAGRIGGSENPWIEGNAAFTIVDLSLKACIGEDENCPTPWDYCCSTDKLPTSTALITVVDGEGKMLKQDARKLMGLKELQTVVVQGKASRDEAGNLTVMASSLYVRE